MRKLFLYLLSPLLSFLLILHPFSLGSYAANDVDWLLIKKNNDGEQWIDRGSLKDYPNNEISILTRFFETPKEPETKGKKLLYVMRINCETKKYKDTSVNGMPNLKAKWTSSNNDELIDTVIDKSCEASGLLNE
tara:strand:- start:683 stop:1084 length:402 start_codon:yes stop_codon:yes gene_type:complete